MEPAAEWHQIFNEAWRLMRDFFYDPNMHGVDWLKVKKQYEPLVARISDRDELNDLIGEMVGELSVGHAYVGGGDRPRGKSVGVGLLGIDALPDNVSGYYKITRILKGDPWDEKDTSPLGAPGLGIKEGDYLIAIDNRPVRAAENYMELLVNKAEKSVVVTVNDKPTTEGSRDVIIKTLADEHELRYRDWVLSSPRLCAKARRRPNCLCSSERHDGRWAVAVGTGLLSAKQAPGAYHGCPIQWRRECGRR